MPRKRRRAQRGECRLVDGPSEVGTAGRNKDRGGGGEKKRRGNEKKGREKTGEKMGSQLFFRLACTVPLAITRLERNVFSGLFLASLISNYESETTRWAVAFAGRITLFSSPAYPFCSPRPFLESSRLSSKGSQAVTCLPDPLFLPSSSLSFIRSLTLPRENSSLRYFCAILPSFNSRFLALSHPSSPASSLSPLLPFITAREKCVMYL